MISGKMIRYCPTCNRSSDEVRFIGEFCELCIITRVDKTIPKTVEIAYCKRCGRVKTREGYQRLEKNSLSDAIYHSIGNNKIKLKVRSFDSENASLQVTYEVEDDYVVFQKDIKLKMKNEICKDCYRKSSGYYEALVQLRGDKILIERMVKRIVHFLELRGAYVTKTEEIDKGIDLYISDKVLANKFFMFNKIKPKKSFDLFGMKKGKKLFRNIYALRL